MSEKKNDNNAKVYVYSQQTKIKTAAICDRDQKVSKWHSHHQTKIRYNQRPTATRGLLVKCISVTIIIIIILLKTSKKTLKTVHLKTSTGKSPYDDPHTSWNTTVSIRAKIINE